LDEKQQQHTEHDTEGGDTEGVERKEIDRGEKRIMLLHVEADSGAAKLATIDCA
jgi:hypothetical protein